MIAENLLTLFIENDITTFVGVPDSTLAEFSALVEKDKRCQNIMTANEGSAVAYATGHYLATGHKCCIYMQNSGLGNAINPLMSLAHKEVYDIPYILLIGHRGYPGIKDEPQHFVMGDITQKLLNLIGLFDYYTDNAENAFKFHQSAILVKPGEFNKYEYSITSEVTFTRRQAIETLLDSYDSNTIFVCTTGKASRELYELRNERGESHDNDFLNIGAMGHVSMIALGIAKNTKRQVVCIDGDGSAFMHFGNVIKTLSSTYSMNNLTYVLLDNNCHDSVGGHQINEPIYMFLHINKVSYTSDMLKDRIRRRRRVIHCLIDRESTPNLSRPKEKFTELKQNFINTLRK